MSNLVVHKVKCHGQPAPGSTGGARTATQDKFVCKVCSQRFQRKAQLTLHEERVHGSDPLKNHPAAATTTTSTATARNKFINRGRSQSKSHVMVDNWYQPVRPFEWFFRIHQTEGIPDKKKPRGDATNRVLQSKQEDGTTAGLLIDAIQTPGMQEARNIGQTAFALLKSIDGTPSLVKIFDLPNNKQVSHSNWACSLLRSGAWFLRVSYWYQLLRKICPEPVRAHPHHAKPRK